MFVDSPSACTLSSIWQCPFLIFRFIAVSLSFAERLPWISLAARQHQKCGRLSSLLSTRLLTCILSSILHCPFLGLWMSIVSASPAALPQGRMSRDTLLRLLSSIGRKPQQPDARTMNPPSPARSRKRQNGCQEDAEHGNVQHGEGRHDESGGAKDSAVALDKPSMSAVKFQPPSFVILPHSHWLLLLMDNQTYIFAST